MTRQERISNRKSLIFLHIPKAGGTTLHRIIERNYRKNVIFSIRAYDIDSIRKSIDELKNLPEMQRARLKVLRGHMPFGLHEHLPQPSTYITMLRNPVDRVLSHYYYARQRPDHYLHDEARRMNLRDYVCSGISAELENGQVRLLSGVKEVDGINGSEPCSTETLEIAKRNLREHFAVVGITERFDEFLILLKRELGFRNVFYIPLNITRDKKDTPNDTSFIAEHNKLDMELYRYACKMFDEFVCQQDPLFASELERFRFWNKLYGVINKPYERVYQAARKNELVRSIYKRMSKTR